jgi:SAM-dependent methyltransferase
MTFDCELLPLIACPKCREGLAVEDAGASLSCAGCLAVYPIVGGVPRFVAPENYAASFGYQWNIHAHTQLDSFTGVPISADRLFLASAWPRHMFGELVLEAGSGAGRFTEVLLATGAHVVSVDYSAAVEANASNNGDMGRLLLCQADILSLPVRERSFDRVMCLGVLQHTPDPLRAFQSLARAVRSGGSLVVDAYENRLLSVVHWRYLLRPLTRRIPRRTLYKWTERLVPPLVAPAALLRRWFGRIGARLLPISEFSYLGLPPDINRQWAILDTFDMLSPRYDHPQSLASVRSWFEAGKFSDVVVFRGPNGVIGRGVAP